MGMPVICPDKITKERAVGDIIESISMEQRSLAHILNAESEKLQFIISMPEVTSQQLLMFNQSVKSTIDAVSRLEMLLQAKLDFIHNTICDTK